MSLLIKKGRLRWLGDVECKDDADWAKCCMEMEVDRTCQREGNPRKTCWDGVMEDMKSLVCLKSMHRLGTSRLGKQECLKSTDSRHKFVTYCTHGLTDRTAHYYIPQPRLLAGGGV